MRVLIIEDEIPAAEKLERYLNKYDPFLEILATLGSVKKSVNWFTTSDIFPDLIFMDIQLTDGLSFEIFKKVKITQPIIFTTAFNQYAIDAFKANGIDYLLKPIYSVKSCKAPGIICFDMYSSSTWALKEIFWLYFSFNR